MRAPGQAMRSICRLPGLLALVALGPGVAAARADDTLIGTWSIEVHGGEPQGDFGTVTIRRDGDRLVGDMVYTDTRANITATELCQVLVGDPRIWFYCEVLAPEIDTYWPDNFAMRRVGPDRMEGDLFSVSSGPATMTRGEVPTS